MAGHLAWLAVLLKVWVPVLDTFLDMVLMFFYCTVVYLLMLTQSKKVGKRIETAVLYHSPIFFCLYLPSSISDKTE